MSIQLLYAALALMLGTPIPPNYYSNYTSAKKAAKDAQKEMVVFFGSSTCGNCESAWSAYVKDAASTQQYISTKMAADDFDGAVCFAYYGLKDVPAWVIITPSAEVKEKWNGGWKDAAGNPTLFDQTISLTKVTEQKINNPSTTPATQKPSATNQPVQKMEPTNTNPTTHPTSNNQQPQTGFVLQAGYFGSEVNAQKLIGDLKTKGFTNYKIEQEQKDGKTFYRVISKVYATESEVNTEQQHMSSLGFKTSVKKY